VLALQHLKPAGYELGPRLILRSDQLEAMCGVLGPFHALGYATRILEPQVHERLRNGLITLPFVFEAGVPNIFEVLYRVALDRFFEFYDRCRDQLLQADRDTPLAEKLEKLRERFFDQPIQLMEHIRSVSCDPNESDSYFSTFVHGDFNRNNVMFHENSNGTVDNIKMIDFQELRYSSTALDISFFLYMNTPSEEREIIFPRLLRLYHEKMYGTLELILNRNKDNLSDEQLQQFLESYR